MQFIRQEHERVSADTKKKKSVIIRDCRKCKAAYEVTDEFQSHQFCPDCRKPVTCVHGLRNTEKCEQCRRISGSYFIRQM